MKLYLSSYRIPDPKVFSEFVGKEPSDIKLALILNAQDYKPKEIRTEKLAELLGYFSNLGFRVGEVNLLDYRDDNKRLLEKFKEFDVLWLNGGNTYCLRSVIAQCRAEEILKEALRNGVVYGGDSAGAILAGPTLKHYETADDPSVASSVIYGGLGLVDFCAIPHWGSEKYRHVLEGIENNLQKDGYKTARLTDAEYLLAEGRNEIFHSKN